VCVQALHLDHPVRTLQTDSEAHTAELLKILRSPDANLSGLSNLSLSALNARVQKGLRVEDSIITVDLKLPMDGDQDCEFQNVDGMHGN
jgi:hypothetical protein